ncbi:MAG TPA: SelB C-terminal domain-containing protein [Nocardioidaceae bacterium]
MHVIATAGHVDHGKSTLVRALTGTDPDRLEEEHRRGLSIELGYCWTDLPGAGDVAFVDVPGHERFVATMLAGVGPVPAVLFVVAADDPWMPQAAEHLAALDALGVRHGVLAVTRADLADPAPMLDRAGAELARTSLAGSPAVAVSGRTGQGLDELRALLTGLVASLPAPDPDEDVRLWVDRCFHVKGAGTVVTGTLPAGRVAVGDTLAVGATRSGGQHGGTVRVRGVQSLGRPVPAAEGVARVALNLTGGGVAALDRGSVLVTPGAWELTGVVDVRVSPGAAAGSGDRLPERPLLHIGATAVGARTRPLGEDLVRLVLDRPLPLRVADRALLRDPGSRRLWGVTVLDPVPPQLRRRGAARQRAAELARVRGRTDLAGELARRRLARLSLLTRIGVDTTAPASAVRAGDWLVDRRHAEDLTRRMRTLVTDFEQRAPLEQGMPVAALAQALHLPDPEIIASLVAPPLRVAGGRVTGREAAVLPVHVERAVAALAADLEQAPFAAPTADRLRELGLDAKSVAAAARAGRLLRLADGIVLLPGAEDEAVRRLAGLPQPFTASEARRRLDTSRRVALPLLAHLDRHGRTRRLEDDRRFLADEH